MRSLDLKVEPKDMIDEYNTSAHILYSICYVKSKIQMLGYFNTCKEIFLYTIAKQYLKNKDLTDLKLIIKVPIDFESKAKCVIKTIDMFSAVNKWGKSSIYKINTLVNSFIIDLPKQWFKFPQLMSIITLIIYSCYVFNTEHDSIENFINDVIENFIDGVVEKNLLRNNFKSVFKSPRNWMSTIPLIINNYKYLFKDEDPSYLYNWVKCAGIDVNKYTKQSGIKALCFCSSLSSTLNKKIIKLEEKK